MQRITLTNLLTAISSIFWEMGTINATTEWIVENQEA